MRRNTTNTVIGIVFALLIAACSSAQYASYRGLGYASQYSLNTSVVGPYDISRLTPAPQQIVYMLEFERAPDTIFTPMLTEVADYTEIVKNTRFDHSRSSNPGQMGVGSVRICEMEDGSTLIEPLVVYQRDRFYAYRVDRNSSTMKMPIDNVVLFYSFEETGAGRTLLTIRAHYDAPGRIGEPFVDAGFRDMVTPSFEKAAKHYGGRMIDPAR